MTEPAYSLESEFDVQSTLGQGGFSVVKEVYLRGQKEGISTAVKITPISTVKELFGPDLDRLVHRWEWAKRANASNKSKHLIRFLDYRYSDHDYFAFLEMCRGGDLFDRIINHPSGTGCMPEESARKVAYNLLEAVAELHQKRCIHRDLKPENILYRQPDSPDEDAVVADYGVTICDVQPGQMFTGLAGSAGYVAPEMVLQQPYSYSVDIFSLGVLVRRAFGLNHDNLLTFRQTYEMLTGRSPFISQDDVDELLKEVVERDIAYPRKYWGKLSFEAKDICQCMLEKDPNVRWTAAELLRHPWFGDLSIERDIGIVVADESQADERIGLSLRRRETASSLGTVFSTSSGMTCSTATDSSSSGSFLLDHMSESQLNLPRLATSVLRREGSLYKSRVRTKGVFDTKELLDGLPLPPAISRKFTALDKDLELKGNKGESVDKIEEKPV